MIIVHMPTSFWRMTRMVDCPRWTTVYCMYVCRLFIPPHHAWKQMDDMSSGKVKRRISSHNTETNNVVPQVVGLVIPLIYGLLSPHTTSHLVPGLLRVFFFPLHIRR